jgi:hypothetical protein
MKVTEAAARRRALEALRNALLQIKNLGLYVTDAAHREELLTLRSTLLDKIQALEASLRGSGTALKIAFENAHFASGDNRADNGELAGAK